MNRRRSRTLAALAAVLLIALLIGAAMAQNDAPKTRPVYLPFVTTTTAHDAPRPPALPRPTATPGGTR